MHLGSNESEHNAFEGRADSNINQDPKFKKKKSNFGKLPENLLKYLHINFQIWFPKYKFKNPKYIKNVEVHSLRTPDLRGSL